MPNLTDKSKSARGLREIAEIAGVSTATVSRAVNSPHRVSEEVRQRIQSIIQQLNWVPSGAARALVKRKAETVGAVFPQMTHGDFARAIEGLQSELSRMGYTLLLACSDYDPEREFAQVKKFVERGVDAILLVGEAHHEGLTNFLQKNEVPLLNMFVYEPTSTGVNVGPDNRKALFRLTQYLIGLGHQRIAVMAQDGLHNDRARARLQGIKDALAEHGLAVRPEHLVTGRFSINEGRGLFRQILAQGNKPTAIVCGNAYLAVGAMLESQAAGIDVPGEMSIVGYDDIELMSELPIPITTVRVHGGQVGVEAARRIVQMIDGHMDAAGFECEAEIVIRASSGPVPSGIGN